VQYNSTLFTQPQLLSYEIRRCFTDKRSLFSLFVLPLVVLATSADAAVDTSLSVNFRTEAVHLIPPSSSNVAGVIPTRFWNSSTGAGLSSAVLSNGSSSPINVSISGPPNGVIAAHTQISEPTNNDERLMGGSFDLHGGTLTLSVSGLPTEFTSRGYDVYVYAWGNDIPRQQGQYQVDLDLGRDNVDDGIPSIFFQQDIPTFTGFDNSGQSPNVGEAGSANYFRIANVGQGQDSFDIDITGSDWTVINGFQIVVIPEPALALYWAATGATLACRRRRARRQ